MDALTSTLMRSLQVGEFLAFNRSHGKEASGESKKGAQSTLLDENEIGTANERIEKITGKISLLEPLFGLCRNCVPGKADVCTDREKLRPCIRQI